MPLPIRNLTRLASVSFLRQRAALHRQHLHLAELSDHLLDDIGLGREAALEQARRPFWDAPDHWKRRP